MTFCPVTFCLCDVLSCDILSMWRIVCVAFCRDILSCDILSCGVLSAPALDRPEDKILPSEQPYQLFFQFSSALRQGRQQRHYCSFVCFNRFESVGIELFSIDGIWQSLDCFGMIYL